MPDVVKHIVVVLRGREREREIEFPFFAWYLFWEIFLGFCHFKKTLPGPELEN